MAEAARSIIKPENGFTGIYRDGRDSIRDGDRADESDCRIHKTSGGERNHFPWKSKPCIGIRKISGNRYKTVVFFKPGPDSGGRRF